MTDLDQISLHRQYKTAPHSNTTERKKRTKQTQMQVYNSIATEIFIFPGQASSFNNFQK